MLARLGLRFLYAPPPAAVAGSLVSGLVIGAFWGMGPVFAQRIGLDNDGVAALMGATILGGAAEEHVPFTPMVRTSPEAR